MVAAVQVNVAGQHHVQLADPRQPGQPSGSSCPHPAAPPAGHPPPPAAGPRSVNMPWIAPGPLTTMPRVSSLTSFRASSIACGQLGRLEHLAGKLLAHLLAGGAGSFAAASPLVSRYSHICTRTAARFFGFCRQFAAVFARPAGSRSLSASLSTGTRASSSSTSTHRH